MLNGLDIKSNVLDIIPFLLYIMLNVLDIKLNGLDVFQFLLY